MDETYEVDVIVVPGPTWTGGTVNIALDEVHLFTPTGLTWATSYLDLDDTSTVFYYKNELNPDGTLEPVLLGSYNFGDTVPVYVPAEGGAGRWFEISHKWYWIPPYHLGFDIFGTISSACAGTLGDILTGVPGGGIAFTTLMAILTELQAVKEIEYKYAGYCNGVRQEINSVRVEVCSEKHAEFELSAIMQITASVSTTVAIISGWNPVGWAAAATEAALWIAGAYQYGVAADPPDSNYTQVTGIEVPEVPELADINDPGLRRVSEDAILFAAVTRSFLISVERYYGAVAAGALEWQMVQLEAAKHYLSMAQELSARLSSYWSAIAPNLPVPSAADIEAAREYLLNNGLPEIEVSCLLAFGYDQTTIDYIASITATLDDEYFMDPNRIWMGLATISEQLGIVADGLPEPPPSIALCDVDIDPDVLNFKSEGRWVTCYIGPPEGYDVSDIDIGTLKLQNTVTAESTPTGIGDHDSDGIPDLMVKFDQKQLIQLFDPGEQIIALTGQFTDGTPLAGIDVIRVIP
ncbi:MAG: hypothetical protein ACYS9T_02700 [Planctomycetota bacterium]